MLHDNTESQKTNSITEIVFEDALKQARGLDDYFKKIGELKGPLHGIPITLKDQFDIKGVDSTLGYVGRCFKPATEDAVLVQLLKNMGAVIIAKTNLPQSIMVRIPPLMSSTFLLFVCTRNMLTMAAYIFQMHSGPKLKILSGDLQ